MALSETDAASVASIMNVLPDPAELAPGTLVVVAAEIAAAPSLARSVLSVFRGKKTVRRALRCSALVARGYVRVGAGGVDDDDEIDIAWGYASAARVDPAD